MQAVWDTVRQALAEETVGFLGGAIFFGSWLLQAWQSKRAGTAVVSQSFFVLRALASALLTVEGIRSGSVSITLLMGSTLLLMLYNIWLIRRRDGAGAAGPVG